MQGQVDKVECLGLWRMKLHIVAPAILHIIAAPYQVAGGVVIRYLFPGNRSDIDVRNAIGSIERRIIYQRKVLPGKAIVKGYSGGINDADGGMAGKGIKRICASERNLLAVGATLPLVFAFQLCERVWLLFAAKQRQDTDEHTEHYIL
jgi:hypothetical protein